MKLIYSFAVIAAVFSGLLTAAMACAYPQHDTCRVTGTDDHGHQVISCWCE